MNQPSIYLLLTSTSALTYLHQFLAYYAIGQEMVKKIRLIFWVSRKCCEAGVFYWSTNGKMI